MDKKLKLVWLTIFFIFLFSVSLVMLLFRPFFYTNSKINLINEKKSSCQLYQSGNLYIAFLKQKQEILIIDKKSKLIYLPNDSYWFLGDSILFWRRDHLIGVPLTSCAKVGEQDLHWTREGVTFTIGHKKALRVKITWL